MEGLEVVGKPYSREIREHALRLLDSGLSIFQVHRRMKLPERLLREWRRREFGKQRDYEPLTFDEQCEIYDMHLEDIPQQKIAARTSRSRHTVRRVISLFSFKGPQDPQQLRDDAEEMVNYLFPGNENGIKKLREKPDDYWKARANWSVRKWAKEAANALRDSV